MEYKPIDTAPKDEKWVLLYIPEFKKTTPNLLGVWDKEYESWIDVYEGCPLNPSHWAELPQPPIQ